MMRHRTNPLRRQSKPCPRRSNFTSAQDFNLAFDDWAYGEASPVEEPTSGLEEIVQWEDLEEALDTGAIESKAEFSDALSAQMGSRTTARTTKAVLAGLFPEYREKYHSLPKRRRRNATPAAAKLDAERVQEIRQRHIAGERQTSLAKEYGVRQSVISDLINYKTWRNVA